LQIKRDYKKTSFTLEKLLIFQTVKIMAMGDVESIYKIVVRKSKWKRIVLGRAI
jgi:hypothetical protein